MNGFDGDTLALASALDAKMGLQLTEVSAERVVGRMPVEGNTQPTGLWHGGASCVLAETLASVAASVAVAPRAAYGVELNATHLRPGRSGWITGTATAVRIGRTLLTYNVELVDDEGRQICQARVTCMAPH